MTHPRNADEPHKPAGTKSPAERKQRAEQMDRAEKRARRRFRIVRWVNDQEIEDRPHTQFHAQIEEAIDQGELEVAEALSYSTLNRWMKKAKKLDYPPVELADWFDKNRDGRLRKEIDDRLREFILQELKLNPGLSTSQLRRMVERKADDLEVEAPTYDWLHRYERGRRIHRRARGGARQRPSARPPLSR